MQQTSSNKCEAGKSWLQPIALAGKHVRLEPLSQQHCEDLKEVVLDGEMWKLWYTRIPEPDQMAAEIDRRLKLQKEESMLPFAVIDALSGKAVGMTTYMAADSVNKRVEIGSTWYGRCVQRSGLNTECKLLMLTHAFEVLECIAVEFRTSNYNFQSQKAILRLGAKLDGVLRSHALHANGTLRDTHVYSIIKCEWPGVKVHLQYQLEKPR